jgi:hypothetical protein
VNLRITLPVVFCSIIYTMPQKGFVNLFLVLVVLAVIASFALGYYLGKYPPSQKVNTNDNSDQIRSEIDKKLIEIKLPEIISQFESKDEADYDPEEVVLKNVKTTADLPDIAAAVIKDSLLDDEKLVPRIEFQSNDGEYSTVRYGHFGVLGSGVAWLVKRNGIWIVVFKGNGYGDCSEILPVRQQFAIKPDFLPCGDEIVSPSATPAN